MSKVLITGSVFNWGRDNFVRLEPWSNVAHVLALPVVDEAKRQELAFRELSITRASAPPWAAWCAEVGPGPRYAQPGDLHSRKSLGWALLASKSIPRWTPIHWAPIDWAPNLWALITNNRKYLP